MIRAVFLKNTDGNLRGVSVEGHAGFAEAGRDIVCAGVSSALQLTANAITDSFGIPAKVTVRENQVRIRLPEGAFPTAEKLLEAFRAHLTALAEDYPDAIQLNIMEV